MGRRAWRRSPATDVGGTPGSREGSHAATELIRIAFRGAQGPLGRDWHRRYRNSRAGSRTDIRKFGRLLAVHGSQQPERNPRKTFGRGERGVEAAPSGATAGQR